MLQLLLQLTQVKFTDVTRPFYSKRRQAIKKSEWRKRVGNARLPLYNRNIPWLLRETGLSLPRKYRIKILQTLSIGHQSSLQQRKPPVSLHHNFTLRVSTGVYAWSRILSSTYIINSCYYSMLINGGLTYTVPGLIVKHQLVYSVASYLCCVTPSVGAWIL